ncbi:MAG: hypothetical protein Q7S40_17245 [Opitutaceae bacterium]|nr:hypothetical protein [Opitutaceae bacterium]
MILSSDDDRPNNIAHRMTRMAAIFALFATALGAAEIDYEAARAQVAALGRLSTAPAAHAAEGFAAEGGIEPLFYDGLPWKGKPTRVFAWLGRPQERNQKLPAIVLIHGGGGTAFKEWVRRWNEHGSRVPIPVLPAAARGPNCPLSRSNSVQPRINANSRE